MSYDSDKPMYVWPIDMTGPDGNGFVMIGHAIKQMKAFGHNKDFIESFREEAMSGDYEKLKATIKNYFNVVVPTTTYELLEEEDSEEDYSF